MLEELQTKEKVVGLKQLRKALAEGRAAKVFLAQDADPKLLDPIRESCRSGDVPMEEVDTMTKLGRACGIEVGAAAAGLLKKS